MSEHNSVFKAVCLNARSLTKKFLFFHFEIIVEQNYPDFIALTETWLNDSYPDSSFPCHSNYSIFRKDRKSSTGGGVALLVKNNISCCQIETDLLDPLEAIAVEVFCGDDVSFILLNVYKPNVSDTHLLRPLFDALCYLRTLGKRLIVMGDFNLPDINWSTHSAPQAHLQDKFLDCFISNGLTQFVNEPTRGKNILDLVFSNELSLVQNFRIGDSLGNSDHNSVWFEITTPTDRPSTPSARLNWSKADFTKMIFDLELINWSLLFSECHNIDELWDCFEGNCLRIINESVPLFPTRNPNRRPFLPNKIKNILSAKRKYFKHRWDSPFSLSKYKQLVKKSKKVLRNHQFEMEQKLISNPDRKKLFQTC